MPQVVENEELDESKPGPEVSDPGFFGRLRDLDWNWHMAYVSRNEPFRPNTDRNPYLVKYSEPFDEDTLRLAFGSGVYAIRINKRNPKTGKDKTVEFYKATIIDKACPPVLVGYDGWHLDPRNKPWLWGFTEAPKTNGVSHGGGLTADDVLKIVDRVTAQLKPGPEQKDALQTALIDALKTGNQAAIEMVKTQAGEQSPDKVVSMINALKQFVKAEQPADSPDKMIAMITALKGLMATPAPDPVGTVTSTVKALGELIAIVRPPSIETDSVEKSIVKSFLEKAMDRVFSGEDGGSGSSKWDFWGNVVREVVPGVRDIVHDGVAAWQTNLMMKAGIPPAGWVPVVPNPAPREAPALAGPVNPGPTAPAPEPPPSGSAGVADPRLQVLQQVAVGFMNHLMSGQSGADFAEWVEGGYGALAYDQLVSLGQDGLLNMLKQSPFWNQLAPIEAKVTQFLTDFIDWGKDDATPEETPKQNRPNQPKKGKGKA